MSPPADTSRSTETLRSKNTPGTHGLPESATICVIGAGRSGCAAARQALGAGYYHVTLIDQRPREDLHYLDEAMLDKLSLIQQPANSQKIRVTGKRSSTDQLPVENDDRSITHVSDIDLIVISPGVPASAIDNPNSLPIWSEVEFAYRFVEDQSKIIGITGSNGKSTTTALVDHLFSSYDLARRDKDNPGPTHWTAGNIGKPLSEYLVEGNHLPDWIILELSSYQLEHIDRFRANIAVLLNLSPDHLARYPGGIDDYYLAKRRLFETQQPGDIAICYNDPECKRIMKGRESDAALSGQLNFYGYDDAPTVARIDLCASVLATSHAISMSSSAIISGANSFSGLPHRMEHIATVEKVDYINDSKATNVGAVVASIAGFPKPIILLLGGYDKGLPFIDLLPVIEANCRQVVFFGQAGSEIHRQLSDVASESNNASKTSPAKLLLENIYSDLKQATLAAKEIARPGDAVVLSPACSSFDEFANFEARGHAFERIVKSLLDI